MKTIYLILLLFFLFNDFQVLAQSCTVYGTVSDISGERIPFVIVKDKNTDNKVTTDFDGSFMIEIKNCDSCNLLFSYVGYKTKEVNTDGEVHLDVKMTPSMTHLGPIFPEAPYEKPLWGVIGSIKFDFTYPDFNEFTDILGDENIKFLNKSGVLLMFGIDISYKDIFSSFQWGYGKIPEYEPDSVQMELKEAQYGLFVGYYIINSKHFLVAPELALKWFRYRLLNFDKRNNLPIETYLENRELDLRFNQLMGYTGIKVAYKMQATIFDWSIGTYVGYIGKLTKKPWINSNSNQLTSDKKIYYKKLNFGITFSIHTR
ncbi:MAG: carboxypeptidase-like regulatory domain-containing protein [Bacteroidales bacterium]|nr:carboxypeptidase-like regulatory domain-containing protein [Bacteroidales bacterium]